MSRKTQSITRIIFRTVFKLAIGLPLDISDVNYSYPGEKLIELL